MPAPQVLEARDEAVALMLTVYEMANRQEHGAVFKKWAHRRDLKRAFGNVPG